MLPKNYIGRCEKQLNRISNWALWISIAGFVLMTLMIVIDIIGSKLFKWPLPGSMETESLAGLILIAFALPFTQAVKGHIEVELFIERLPKLAQSVVSVFINLLSVLLFVALIWQMFKYSLNLFELGNMTFTQKIPYYPFAFGVCFCFFIAFLYLLMDLVKSVARLVNR
jgi:TRAP-type C4-dicarboxylate transport system permease small subunit